MTPPLFSIIVPTFNAGAHIADCLASLCGQTLGDLEVLVMDGASKDDTVEVVRRLAAADPRIQLHSAPDRGIYDAMNKGVARSRGTWLMFMGADDTFYTPDVLERLRPSLTDDLDLVYGDEFSVRLQARTGGPYTVERLMAETIRHQAMFFRRSFFQRMGEFDLRFRIAADWDMNLRCFAAGARTRHVDLIISRFSGSGISSREIDHAFEALRFDRIAAYWQVPLWHRRLEACRYAFREQALDEWAAGRWAPAIRNHALYVWHVARAKLLGPARAEHPVQHGA